MAVKQVKDYYNQICEQYQEMLENIKDFEELATQGLVEPERVDRLKEQIEPIKINYERWCYMMFLLNQPQRKSKQTRYKREQQKLLAKITPSNTADGVIQENAEAMKHIGE